MKGEQIHFANNESSDQVLLLLVKWNLCLTLLSVVVLMLRFDCNCGPVYVSNCRAYCVRIK